MSNIYFSNRVSNISDHHGWDLNFEGAADSFEMIRINFSKRLKPRMRPSLILAIFHEELSSFLPINGIRYFGRDEYLSAPKLEVGQSSFNTKIYSNSTNIGQLQFDLSFVITESQKIQITQLSQLLSFPLCKALQYHNLNPETSSVQETNSVNCHEYSLAFKNSVINKISQDQCFSILTLNINGFKTANAPLETHTPFMLLKEVSLLISNFINKDDELYRCGDEQFSIILNNPLDVSTEQISLNLEKKIQQNPILSSYKISPSIGCVQYKLGDDSECLLNRLEASLTKAITSQNNYDIGFGYLVANQ